jgi:hypothetical protein
MRKQKAGAKGCAGIEVRGSRTLQASLDHVNLRPDDCSALPAAVSMPGPMSELEQ